MHGVEDHLREIVNHHDLSGRYPQSAPDFRAEIPVIEFARRPLDGSHEFLNAIFGKSSESKGSSESIDDVRIHIYPPSDSEDTANWMTD